MKAVRFHEHGDETVLQVDDVAEPTPGYGDVKVRTRAASVNPIDTYIREGDVAPADDLPHIGGADVAGVVRTVGDGVDGFEPGDRVFATGLGLFGAGSYGEYVTVPATRLAPLPDGVSFVDGAAAAMAFATAWRALVVRGSLAVGDVCLVQGGSGGVGHAAVQVARHAGATVLATAREGPPASFVRDLGADAVVDYRSDDLAGTLREAADGRDVDVVLETHAGSNLTADLDLLARGGRVVVIGEDGEIRLSPNAAMTGKVSDADVRLMSIMASTDDQASILRRVGPLLADGTFEVAVAATYPLAEAGAAQRHATSDGTLGKVVIDTT